MTTLGDGGGPPPGEGEDLSDDPELAAIAALPGARVVTFLTERAERLRRREEARRSRRDRHAGAHAGQEPPARFRDLTHDGLALDMGHRWRGTARHVATWGKWFFWAGDRWRADEKLEHMTRTRSFLRARGDELVAWAEGLLRQAESDGEKLERAEQTLNQMKAIAQSLRTASMINNVVSLARSNVELVAVVDQWDADRLALGTPERKTHDGGSADRRSTDPSARRLHH